jgi:hypothetical protein
MQCIFHPVLLMRTTNELIFCRNYMWPPVAWGRDPGASARSTKSFSFSPCCPSPRGSWPGSLRRGNGSDDGGRAGTVWAVAHGGRGAPVARGSGLAVAVVPMVNIRVRGFGLRIRHRRFRGGWVRVAEDRWWGSGGSASAAGGAIGAMMNCSNVKEGHTFIISHDGLFTR